jgi:hypothetical protein
MAVALKSRLCCMVIQLVKVDVDAFASDGRGMSIALTNCSVFFDAQCAELREVLLHAVTDGPSQNASDPVRQQTIVSDA